MEGIPNKEDNNEGYNAIDELSEIYSGYYGKEDNLDAIVDLIKRDPGVLYYFASKIIDDEIEDFLVLGKDMEKLSPLMLMVLIELPEASADMLRSKYGEAVNEHNEEVKTFFEDNFPLIVEDYNSEKDSYKSHHSSEIGQKNLQDLTKRLNDITRKYRENKDDEDNLDSE